MSIAVALIGSGIFAKEEHLPAIQNTPALSLKAVYSRSLKSAQALSEKLSDVELYSDDSDGKKYESVNSKSSKPTLFPALMYTTRTFRSVSPYRRKIWSCGLSVRFRGVSVFYLLEAKDAGVPLDCCIEVGHADCDVVEDVVVYLGLSGDVNGDLRAAVESCEDVVAAVGDLRKTRAGGN